MTFRILKVRRNAYAEVADLRLARAFEASNPNSASLAWRGEHMNDALNMYLDEPAFDLVIARFDGEEVVTHLRISIDVVATASFHASSSQMQDLGTPRSRPA